jgi:hypothetical protein
VELNDLVVEAWESRAATVVAANIVVVKSMPILTSAAAPQALGVICC